MSADYVHGFYRFDVVIGSGTVPVWARTFAAAQRCARRRYGARAVVAFRRTK